MQLQSFITHQGSKKQLEMARTNGFQLAWIYQGTSAKKMGQVNLLSKKHQMEIIQMTLRPYELVFFEGQ